MLPKVIIYDILLRLPVKTLLRLKSVSKSWLSLISDPDFTKTHLLKSTNDAHFTRYNLLVSSNRFMQNGEHYDNERLDLESLSLFSLLNEPDTELIKHDCNAVDHDYSDDITHVVCCCNGLVCVASRVCEVYLWNPSTGEWRMLPDLIPESNYFNACGFCYDESDDDFKVYSIFKSNKVSVYSLKTDDLRMIADFPYTIRLYYLYYKGMFANGAMHWACRPADRKSKIEVLLPINGEGECRWTLGTYGKSLSFCNFDSSHADFWVMEKSGVEKSWTKLFTIPYVDRPKDWSSEMLYPNIDRERNLDRPTGLAFLKPINISVNGEIVMMLNSHIQLYNPKDNTYKELFNRGECRKYPRDGGWFMFRYGFNCDVNTYVESLISISLNCSPSLQPISIEKRRLL